MKKGCPFRISALPALAAGAFLLPYPAGIFKEKQNPVFRKKELLIL
jgi:hypothetical protein